MRHALERIASSGLRERPVTDHRPASGDEPFGPIDQPLVHQRRHLRRVQAIGESLMRASPGLREFCEPDLIGPQPRRAKRFGELPGQRALAGSDQSTHHDQPRRRKLARVAPGELKMSPGQRANLPALRGARMLLLGETSNLPSHQATMALIK